MPVEGLDYTISLITEEQDWSEVTILQHPWDGIVVKYGAIKFGSENPDGTLNTHFDYDIIKSADLKPNNLTSDKNFVTFLGEVLIDILSNEIELLDSELIVEENGNEN